MRGVVLTASVLLSAAAEATPARPPSPPAIATGTRTFVAFGGAAAPVRLAWTPAEGVARYRARWTDAGAKIDIELPGNATAFERAERTAGRHQLSIVAIDAEGRESVPAEIAVEVVTVIAVPAGSETAVDTGGPFALGSHFHSPGLRCRFGTGPASDDLVATLPGAMVLACGGETGQPRVELPIVIAPVRVAGPATALERGKTTRIHVTVASVAPLGDRLQVEAIGELELGDAERTEFGLDVPVTVAAAATRASLVVRAGGVELGSVELALVEAAPPPAPRSTGSAWFALDVGGQVGALFPPTVGLSAGSLGNPTKADDVVTAGALAGGRIGVFPTRRVGVEVEAALAMAGYADGAGVATLGLARAQVAARVVEERDLGLRVLAGVDLLGLLSHRGSSQRDAEAGVHYGAAFTIETRHNLWLRLQALHLVTAARDAGYAHCAELTLGLMTRLGRRDRW